MGIDLYTTTLATRLSTLRPHALDYVVDPTGWALWGASRLGRVLTRHDYVDVEEEELDRSRGVDAARAWLAMLAQTEPALVERSSTLLDAEEDDDGFFDRLDTVGLGQVLELARAVQQGIELPEDSDELLQFASPAPRVSRAEGPMSALLLADAYDVLWMPVPMRFAWDGPMGAVASTHQLRADLELLPSVLRTDGPPTNDAWLRAWSVVDAFYGALESAGDTHCVALSA